MFYQRKMRAKAKKQMQTQFMEYYVRGNLGFNKLVKVFSFLSYTGFSII